MGFFEYFKEVCNLIEETKKAEPLSDLSRHSNWIFPYQNIAIASEKPEIIKVNVLGKIHCEDGPCVKYRDGFSVWGLNGIRVPKEIVETSAYKLDPTIILKEKNADIRREIVRKIGMERVYNALGGEKIDSKDGYDLILLDLKDGRRRPYLLMTNPSIGVKHLEGVPPDTKTVYEALAFRNGTKTYEKPEVLT